MKKILYIIMAIMIILNFQGCSFSKSNNTNKLINNSDNRSDETKKSTSVSNIKTEDSKNSEDNKTIKVNSDESTKPTTDHSTDSYKEPLPSSSNENSYNASAKEIPRNLSGLDSVAPLDFSKYSLNKRITDILKEPSLYKDEDYKNGLVKTDSSLIINERFSENIIQNVKIGTDIAILKSTLGNPSFSSKDFLFYKTNLYYLGFKGKDKVEQVIIKNTPARYNPQILSIILQELDKKDYNSLGKSLDDNLSISSFFNSNGFLQGGGWYADSFNGIELNEFPGANEVTIYNNFDGKLFKFANENNKFKVIFKNEDYIVNLLSREFDNYFYINNEFETKGTLSPSGKRKSIYQWFFSSSHYFTIRTVDNSKPDFKLHASSGEYRWLNDNYILYIHAIYNIPFIIRVDQNSDESIDVFTKLGVMKDGISSDELIIDKISDNSIVLKGKSEPKTYTINYTFNNDGSINLSMVK